MPKAPKYVDVSQLPEVLAIAEEVRNTQEPRLLKKGDQELAMLVPLGPWAKGRSKSRAVTRGDAIFQLIGIGRSGIAGGISGDKHKRLAEAYRHR